MLNIYQKLSKLTGMDEFELETSLNEMGIKARGCTLWVTIGKNNKKRISVEDTIRYFCFEAQNLSSGIRTLGTINGDWRLVDELAKTCLKIYKVLKYNELKRMARKYGMELKR